MIRMFIKKWGLASGCGDWKDWSEGASEDIAVGRRCYSETVQEKDPKSEGGQSWC